MFLMNYYIHTYINSFEDNFVDIHDHILNINNYSFLCISMYTIYQLQSTLESEMEIR